MSPPQLLNKRSATADTPLAMYATNTFVNNGFTKSRWIPNALGVKSGGFSLAVSTY